MSTQDILRNPNKHPILLADGQIAYEVSRHRFPSGSIFNGGELWFRNFVINGVTYQNCEYVNINPYIHGIRRDVERVTVGGVEYTEVNSVHSCDETAGSWFYDSNICRLYVRPAINLPFDKVFTFDNGTSNYLDETEDARSATTGDVTMKGSMNDKHYIGMQYSRHRFWRFKFSTNRVGGTSGWAFWDDTGTGWSTITADVIALTGSKNLTSADNILHWIDPQNEWNRYDQIGDDTGATPTGKPTMFWIRINNDSAYGTPGVGSQFFVSPVLEESIVVAWLGIPIGNKTVHIDGKNYLGRLILSDQNTTSQMSSKNTDAFQEAVIGTTITGSGGDITISNGDGAYDNVQEDGGMAFLGGKWSFRMGYDTANFTMPIEDYIQFRNCAVDGISWTEQNVKLSMMNETLKMDIKMLQQFLSVADYQNMTPDLEGKAIPIYFGNTETLATIDATPEEKWARGLPGTIVKPGQAVGGGRKQQGWKFGAEILNPETGVLHSWGAIAQIMEWKANKPVDRPANDYDAAEGNTRINFKNNAAPTEGEVRFRGQGITDDADGTFTGVANGVIAHPLHVARFILICICKYKSTDLYLPSFIESGDTIGGVAGETVIPDDWNDNVSVYVNSDSENAREVINRLMIGMFGILQPNNDGKLQVTIRAPLKDTSGIPSPDIDPGSGGLPSVTTPVLFRHQTGEFEIKRGTDFPAANIVLKYRQYPATNGRTASETTQYSIILNGSAFNIYISTNYATAYLNKNNLIEFDTYMVTTVKVNALRSVYLAWFFKPPLIFVVEDIYGQAMEQILGGSVLINRSRSIAGELEEKQIWLMTADRKHGRHAVKFEAIEAATL